MGQSLLQVRNLKTYFYVQRGVAKAVDDVSFDVEAGEFVGLVGEGGCGKSVIARSVMRLVHNSPGKIISGEIIFEGQDLLKLSERAMRRIRGNKIAMIFQQPLTSLNPVLTIGRQLMEGLEIHLKLNRRSAAERAIELLEMVGIPEPRRRINDYPHQFSGGMRQRVMIAMALSCKPKLILADAPTTALDVTIQAQVLELMYKLTREMGVAVLLITSNLGIVARYTDRVFVMYAGRIVESGRAADVFYDPKHPYTVALQRSVPRLDELRKEDLEVIPGRPPDPVRLPGGCPFWPRCDFAVEQCHHDKPSLAFVDEEHSTACWEWKRVTPFRAKPAPPRSTSHDH